MRRRADVRIAMAGLAGVVVFAGVTGPWPAEDDAARAEHRSGAGQPGVVTTPATRPTVQPALAHFETNRGQVETAADFVLRAGRYDAAIDATGMLLRSGDASCVVRLVGAEPTAVVAPQERLPGVSHHLRGSDPAAWITDVPHHRVIRYERVYPAIDAVYGTRDGNVEITFDVQPQGDAGRVAISLDGARSPEIRSDGSVVATTDGGTLSLSAPVAWQDVDGVRAPVGVAYEGRTDGSIGFRLASHDSSRVVHIDPVVAYGSTFGGSRLDSVRALGTDDAGNIYLMADTRSFDFPTTPGSYQPDSKGTEFAAQCTVTKLDPAAEHVQWATYISGSESDTLRVGAVLPSGRVYVAGLARSADYPVTDGAHITTLPTQFSGFLTCLDASGSSLVYSTFLRNPAEALAVAPSGKAYVVLYSGEPDYWSIAAQVFTPTTGALLDEYALVDNPDDNVHVRGVAVDAHENLFLAGRTLWTELPTTPGAYQRTHGGGGTDGWVAKLGPTGELVYQTFVGGQGEDWFDDVAVDAAGNVITVGRNRGGYYPTVNAFDSTGAQEWDVIVTKLDPTGGALEFATYLAGEEDDFAGAIALDHAGNVLLTGDTKSTLFPTVDAFQTTHGKVLAGSALDLTDTWAASLGPAGGMRWSSYLGGAGSRGSAIAPAGRCGGALIGGQTNSIADFAIRLPFQPATTTPPHAFLTIVQDPSPPFEILAPDPAPCTETAQIALQLATCCGARPFDWSVTAGSPHVNGGIGSTSGMLTGTAREAGQYQFTVQVSDVFGRQASRVIHRTVNPLPEITVDGPPAAPIGRPFAWTLAVANGTGPFEWRVDSGAPPTGITFDPTTARAEGSATGGGRERLTIVCVDSCAVAASREYALPAAAFLRLDGKRNQMDLGAGQVAPPIPLALFTELLGGTSLQLTAKSATPGTLAARLVLVDNDGKIVAFAEPNGRRSLKLKGIDIAETGRYFVRLDAIGAFAGSANVKARAKAAKKWKLGATLTSDGGTHALRIGALPGARIAVSVAAARKSAARPTITSILAADGSELLDPSTVKEKSTKATVALATPLVGGDVTIALGDRGSEGGDVIIKIKLKGAKAYTFTLPELVTGGAGAPE